MKLAALFVWLFTSQFLLLQTANAQVGFLDALKSKAKKEVIKKIEGQEKENKAGGPITNKDKLDLYGGHSAPWNVAPAGSRAAGEVEIKGIRLGMPEVLIDEILTRQGFEKTGFNQYSKELVEINGAQKEVTRSMQTGKSVAEKGKVIRRYIIEYQAVTVDDDLINELSEPLRKMAKEGQEKQEALKARYAAQRASSRRNRGSGAKVEYDRYPVDVNSFKLVYEIEYTQAFVNGSQYDQKALMAQIESVFGPPTYAPLSTHARSGSAFGTNEYNWLIYHDAATVPVSEREALLVGVEKKGDRWALKNAFSHPCGASPFKNQLNCVAAPITSAYDDLSRRMAAARIIYSPVMMVKIQSPVVKTRLAWEYIKSAASIREFFNRNNAVKKAPKAKVDF